ncbi:MAG: hypothetical protein IH598_02785 [Bacteroidales bacterium]|nr:hypothetical protein [Bacteroidales bacterium]
MLFYKYFAALPLKTNKNETMIDELKIKKVQRTASFVEIASPNRSKGAEQRNLTIGNVDIPVRCTSDNGYMDVLLQIFRGAAA